MLTDEERAALFAKKREERRVQTFAALQELQQQKYEAKEPDAEKRAAFAQRLQDAEAAFKQREAADRLALPQALQTSAEPVTAPLVQGDLPAADVPPQNQGRPKPG